MLAPINLQAPPVPPARLEIEPMRSVLPAQDIDGFFTTVAKILEVHQTVNQIPDPQKVILTEDYPKDRTGAWDTTFPVVTFGVEFGEPSGDSKDGHDRKPWGPRQKSETPSKDKSGYSIYSRVWGEYYRVKFTAWGKSNSDANQRALDFHRMLLRYVFYMNYLEAAGIVRFRWSHRGPDRIEKTTDQDLYARDLFYDVWIQVVDVFEAKTLTSITVTVDDDASAAQSGSVPMQLPQISPPRPGRPSYTTI